MNKGLLTIWIVLGFFLVFTVGSLCGVYIAQLEESKDEWQGALHISNWTNRTLNLTLYVLGGEGDWAQFRATLEHEQNVTVTVTWFGTVEALVFIYAVDTDVESWMVYTLERGEWKAVILI